MPYQAHDRYTLAMVGGMVARQAGRQVESCPHGQDSLCGKAWRIGFSYDGLQAKEKPGIRETVSRETKTKRVGGRRGTAGDRLAWSRADHALLDRMLAADGFPLKLAAEILGRSYGAVRTEACRRRKSRED